MDKIKQNWQKVAVGGVILAGIGYYVYKNNQIAQQEEPVKQLPR